MNVVYWFAGVYFLAAIFMSFRLHPRVYTALCGHETVRRGQVFIEGWWVEEVKVPFRNGRPVYCLGCLESMSIICGTCARPILLGDPVRLKPLTEKPKVLFPGSAILQRKAGHGKGKIRRFPAGNMSPETAERLFRHGGQASLVSCCREECSGPLFAPDGYWMYPGSVMDLSVAWKRKLKSPRVSDQISGLVILWAAMSLEREEVGKRFSSLAREA